MDVISFNILVSAFCFQNRVNQNESRLFWMGLILCLFIWSIFFIVCLFGFKFKWMVCLLYMKNYVILAFKLKGFGMKIVNEYTMRFLLPRAQPWNLYSNPDHNLIGIVIYLSLPMYVHWGIWNRNFILTNRRNSKTTKFLNQLNNK